MIYFYQTLFLVLTYFLSSIPFGLIIGKIFAKTDIRKSGSGNIGATNVARLLGKKLGFLTFILDALKGGIMVIFARFCFASTSFLDIYLILIGLTAILGHVFSVYLNFRGGKGVATSIAVVFAFDPIIGFFGCICWITSFLIFKISSLSSLIAIFSLIPLSIYYESSILQVIFYILLFALIFYTHRENISRLISGKEKKI